MFIFVYRFEKIDPIVDDLIAKTISQDHDIGTLDFTLMKNIMIEFLGAECAIEFSHFDSDQVSITDIYTLLQPKFVSFASMSGGYIYREPLVSVD
jgi:hypothetical protein